ncbi:uncharacterized protein BJX67DRAFT_380635 [Aspergillus lucknowensis]|uniref:Rhodopsin domain-containing protein n=1 Tax=Aspergillus lucknowensis TaxID=176173 RepID=A0ABR4LT46_9EURO
MGMVINALCLGLARHMWDNPLSLFINPTNLRLLSPNITDLWAVCFAKLSILLLYRRLFVFQREQIFIWPGIMLNVLLYTTFISVPTANPLSASLLMAAVNVFTDFYVVILPLPSVIKLQTSRNRKIGLFVTFVTGFGAAAASLARLITPTMSMHSLDASWVSAELTIYSFVEINVGIIVACVCTFPVVFDRIQQSRISKLVSQSMRSLLGSPGSSTSANLLPMSEQELVEGPLKPALPGRRRLGSELSTQDSEFWGEFDSSVYFRTARHMTWY